MTLTPCIDCGEPTTSSRCPDCLQVVRRDDNRTRPDRKTPPAARGYDTEWNKLSRRARRMQPFCTDCGATTDLQADHSEEAWNRKALGLPLRLRDIDVVCGYHNRMRGRQRPNQKPQGGDPQGDDGRPQAGEAKFASHIVGYFSQKVDK